MKELTSEQKLFILDKLRLGCFEKHKIDDKMYYSESAVLQLIKEFNSIETDVQFQSLTDEEIKTESILRDITSGVRLKFESELALLQSPEKEEDEILKSY